MFVLVKEGRVQMSVPLLSLLPGFKKKMARSMGQGSLGEMKCSKWEEMLEDDSSSLRTYSS